MNNITCFKSLHFCHVPKTLSIFLVSLLFGFQSLAQYFERMYPNTGIIQIGSLDNCRDSGFIVCGSRGNSVLMKIDAAGDTEWIKNDYGDLTWSNAVIQNSAGNYVVVGSGPAQLYTSVARINTYDSSGDFISADSIIPTDGWGTSGISITRSPDRNYTHHWYYSDGYTADNNIFLDNGIVLGGDLTSVGQNAVSINNTGDFYAAGNLLFDMDTAGVWHNNILRLTGNQGGMYYFETDFTTCSITSDGGVMLAGMYDSTGTSYLRLVKIFSGAVVSDTYLSDTSLTNVYDIKETKDGGFAILCSGNAGGNHIVFIAVDSLGSVIWKNHFYGYGTASPVNFRILEDGFVILGISNNDPYIVRTDSLGLTHTTNIASHTNLPGGISIYPNPSTGIFNVSFGDVSSTEISISVFDLVGRNVFSSILQTSFQQLDLSMLAKGVYQFRLTGKQAESISGKFVIE